MSISQNFGNTRPSLLLDFANVGRLDPRVTFARASTARYYDGVTTAKAEENLLLYSQGFDNAAWSKQSITTPITPNTEVAPDGTTTAETITLTAGAGVHAIFQSATAFSGGRVASLFVKAGTHPYVQISFNGDANPWANFDVTSGSGAVGSTGSNQTASIFDAGNGWYRCIVFTASTTATNFYVTFVDSSTSARQQNWTAVGTETVYLWGAQLEQRSAVTAYTATTTQPITNYVPVLLTAQNDEARFDHDPVTGESKGLLIEEQRTNLLTYSEDFADAAWTKTRSSITSNTIVAPDGTLTGDKIIADTSASTTHLVSASQSVTSGTAYTVSVFAKAAEYGFVRLGLSGFFTTVQSAIFSLSDGSVGTTTGTITTSAINVGNGWWRLSLTSTATSTGSTSVQIGPSDSSSTANFTGDDYSGIFIWGLQIEAGAFATSYIPTTTTALTRSADAASMTGTAFSDFYNQAEGTIYVAYQKNAGTTGRLAVFEQSNTLTTNGINIDLTNATTARTEGFAGGSAQWALTRTVAQGSPQKLCLGYKVNDIAFVSNGGAVATDTSAVLPSTGVTGLGIGARLTGGDPLNGYIQRLAYYPVRLTDAQLQALTG